MFKISVLLICLLLCLDIPASTIDKITHLPGLKRIKNQQYAGYLSGSSSANLFYWFVESDISAATTPLVLWLNGGPGASSLYGFFMENGPYQINTKGAIQQRKYSWNKLVNYLVIDQPTGVGYSFGDVNVYTNEAESIEQLYQSLLQFYQKHPALKKHPLILSGESYAGKYLPQLAMHIIKDNTIDLRAILVGDPWIDPLIQQKANIDYAYYHGLIDSKTRDIVRTLYKNCAAEINKSSPSSAHANQVCERIQQYIRSKSGGLNFANIIKGEEPDDGPMIRYLNRPDVRDALHVSVSNPPYTVFSEAVAKKFEVGEQDSVSNLYSELLGKGIPIVIYNGLDDGKDSNFLSTERLITTFHWPKKYEFERATTCVWGKEGAVFGYATTGGGLTQIKIRGAGHLAPIDQPERVFYILFRLINKRMMC